MRGVWHVLGALGVVTALAYARDVADPVVVAGTPVPLSVESMRVMADRSCERPPGYVVGMLRRVRDSVVEAGVTPDEMIVCSVHGNGFVVSKGKAGAPGAEYVAGRTGLVWEGGSLEVGRVAPEVAVLELVLPSGEVVEAELHGEVFACFVPEKISSVRIRAYDANGRLLRDAEI
ncbi:hypothetical protein [Lentzea albida]|uniref:Uncharacterized protein n=1 Tax=Lentzea albida TaxID=65499 RepID=A0A1H9F7V3_9PSEU|nr:hypothetical protein [Lentzea albida]SEQ34036.1 hypothetical protein SAMN04488000_102571 [Lentzea albida]